MRYYKDDNFLIVSAGISETSIQEICTIGLNLLVELDHCRPSRTCACFRNPITLYAIFPKVPIQITEEVIASLIDKLQEEGIDFEKESIDCRNIQVEELTPQNDSKNVSGNRQGCLTIEDILRHIFGEDVDEDEEFKDNEPEPFNEAEDSYRCCSSVEVALSIAKKLKLEDYSVIECDEKMYLLTSKIDSKKASFHKFIQDQYKMAFFKEHGDFYYEHCNYQDLEALQFLNAVNMD